MPSNQPLIAGSDVMSLSLPHSQDMAKLGALLELVPEYVIPATSPNASEHIFTTKSQASLIHLPPGIVRRRLVVIYR
jgi:hypothetical protein